MCIRDRNVHAPKGACTFGARLDAEEIDALATYVLDRAAVDWK